MRNRAQVKVNLFGISIPYGLLISFIFVAAVHLSELKSVRSVSDSVAVFMDMAPWILLGWPLGFAFLHVNLWIIWGDRKKASGSRCGDCGARAAKEATYCGECGSKLKR